MSNVLPFEVYGADEYEECWVPYVTRSKAIAMVANEWGCDFISLRARRCYVRAATPEECSERGWDFGCLHARRDEADAVLAWNVWLTT